MKLVQGNIWDLHDLGYPVVIPVNIGWNHDGVGILGAGLAKQAAARFPALPSLWGAHCIHGRETAGVWLFKSLILFPTKPLREAHPELSWTGSATLELVERSTQQLARIPDKLGGMYANPGIALPLVGCGLGGLKRDDVLSILQEHLDDRFTLIERH